MSNEMMSSEQLAPRVTDVNDDGSPAFTYEPWSDGHAIGFRVSRHAAWFIEDGDGTRVSANYSSEDAAWTAARDAQHETGAVHDVKHIAEAVSYVYLNPSTDTFSDGELHPDVFVYMGPSGDPGSGDVPQHFYALEFTP